MALSKVSTVPIPKITSTVGHVGNALSTLEKIGGILCNICQQTFKHKKQIDEHYGLQHKSQQIVYTCVICHKEFLNYKIFHDHCYRHSSRKKFSCDKCQKKFTSRPALQLHEEIHNEQRDINTDIGQSNITYGCKQCSKSFAKFADFMNHSRYCGQKFSCLICNKSFTRKSLMLRHAVCHTDKRNFKCNICHGTFKSQSDLGRHSKLQHENGNKYKCGLCEKTFITSTKLKFHINTHNGHRPFNCEHCEATFTNNPNRIKHIKRVHMTQCCHSKLTLIERMSFEKKSDENAISNDTENIEVYGSIITNKGLQEFACSQCPMLFTCRRSWLRHVKRSHLKYKYRCDSCSKVVVFPNPIQSYETIPSLDSVKPFICDYCGAGFTDKYNLERHIIRAAHLKLDYKCRECGKLFFSSLQLSAHEKFHQNKKPIKSVLSLVGKKNKGLPEVFACQCCDKSFSYHWSRVRHMRNEHGKKFDRNISKAENKNRMTPKVMLMTNVSPHKKVDVSGSSIDENYVFNMIHNDFNDIDDQEKVNLYLNMNEPQPLNDYSKVIYSTNTSLSKTQFAKSDQILNSLDQSLDLQNLTNLVEIDNDLMSYFDSYIHGNVDVDILKDTIDIPGCQEEYVNLDNISPDFTLDTIQNVAPSKIIQDSTPQDNFTLVQSPTSHKNVNGNFFNSNAAFNSQNEIMSFGSVENLPDNVRSQDNMQSFYNIKIVKPQSEISSPRKLLLQINPLFDSKQLIGDKTEMSTPLFCNAYDSNQNLYNSITNTADDTLNTFNEFENVSKQVLTMEKNINYNVKPADTNESYNIRLTEVNENYNGNLAKKSLDSYTVISSKSELNIPKINNDYDYITKVEQVCNTDHIVKYTGTKKFGTFLLSN